MLEANAGSYLSGQQIAEELNISRAAVWKAIKALEKEGHGIEAVTNRGYRLSPEPERIDADRLQSSLKDAGLDITVLYKETTGSTNEDAAAYVRAQGRSVLVIADEQVRGRGRRGRDFFSPRGSGLYLSLGLCDGIKLMQTAKVTAVAAVAVAEAIDNAVFNGAEHSLIKWVNDIYTDAGKVCGILSEAFMDMEDDGGGYIVVGIGINMFTPRVHIPDDIKGKAAWLMDPDDEMDTTSIREAIILDIIRNFFKYMAAPDMSLEIYRKRSMLTGSKVKVNSFRQDEEQRMATVLGIDDD